MNDDPGPLLASGRAADVYDLGDGTVLRRYRNATADSDLEARTMRHLADRGYPVPTVHSVNGPDLVMDLVAGPTLLETVEASPWKVVGAARTLAKLQSRLAEIDAPDWLLAGTADREHRQSVLHLDLHPMNVIMSAAGPVVIDWTNAAGGPPGFDAAMTYVEIAAFATSTTVEAAGRELFTRSFRRLRGARILDPYIVAACDHRLADRNTLPDERVEVAKIRSRARDSRARGSSA